MPKKKLRPYRIMPLQRLVTEEVTDPDEIAAMEEVYRQIKRKKRERAKRDGESIDDRPYRIMPLQRLVTEEVTDPAEIAAMEKLYKRLKREQKEEEDLIVYPRGKKSPKKATKRRRSSKPKA
jgi:3-hydroxyacyl-CoA dehydrogenase